MAAVSAGHKHSAIVCDDGLLFTFGCGANGALGHGADFSDKHWPSLVEALRDEVVVQVSCGQNHTVCLCESGKVFSFGMARHGQCGRRRQEAFMLQDVRERGCDLRACLEGEQKEDRSPFELATDQSQLKDAARHKDQNDGVLLKGDPLAMPCGQMRIPKQFRVDKVVAGFYETSLITRCGRVICYGGEHERLENEPVPKIYDFPNQRVLQISHSWKHHLVLTEDLPSDTPQSYQQDEEDNDDYVTCTPGLTCAAPACRGSNVV